MSKIFKHDEMERLKIAEVLREENGKKPQQNSNKPEDLSMKIKVAFMAKPQENKRKKKIRR